MTGETSRRHAAVDRRAFRLIYAGLAGIIVCLLINMFI
jgi:hypothetical protein